MEINNPGGISPQQARIPQVPASGLQAGARVQLLLPSGGARGFSFIGALQVLEESGITVTRVIANSMGAILGAAWCAGVTAGELEKVVMGWKRWQFLAWDPFSPALFGHRNLRRRVEQLLPVRRFEDLQIPLTVIATDYETGRPVAFNQGELVPPIVGSSLACGIFHPVHFAGHWLVDGGYTEPMPISFATGMEPVLALDPSAEPNWQTTRLHQRSWINFFKLGFLFPQVLKGFDTLMFTHVQYKVQQEKAIVVRPELPGISFIDFHKAAAAIHAGRVAMQAKIRQVAD